CAGAGVPRKVRRRFAARDAPQLPGLPGTGEGLLESASALAAKAKDMVYPIVKFGDPVLENEAADVTEFDTPELHKLLDDMFESMYAAKGVGLAAPQIGVSKKIAVIDC